MGDHYGRHELENRDSRNNIPTRRIESKVKTAASHIKIGGKQITYNPHEVKVSNAPLVTSGPVELMIEAATFKWVLSRADLIDALRPYLHDKLENLPSHHFVKMEPVVLGGVFTGIDFTVVVPEKQ